MINWINEWMPEWINDWTTEFMTDWTNDWMTELMTDCINDWMTDLPRSSLAAKLAPDDRRKSTTSTLLQLENRWRWIWKPPKLSYRVSSWNMPKNFSRCIIVYPAFGRQQHILRCFKGLEVRIDVSRFISWQFGFVPSIFRQFFENLDKSGQVWGHTP